MTVIPSVAKESRFNKINFNNLLPLIKDCFGSSLRNDCKYNNYLSNSEIISLNNKNKNLKSNYYGFLFNKKFHCQKEE